MVTALQQMRVLAILLTFLRRWRNWQTRGSQKPVGQPVGVQLPPSAPFSPSSNLSIQ